MTFTLVDFAIAFFIVLNILIAWHHLTKKRPQPRPMTAREQKQYEEERAKEEFEDSEDEEETDFYPIGLDEDE